MRTSSWWKWGAALLVAFAMHGQGVRAASMSDLWYNPNEAGWGVNMIDQQGTLFVTLFVYAQDGRATWYVGSDVSLVSSTSSQRVYTGTLYQTTGPWFGGVFNAGLVGIRTVGSFTFTATSPVRGTITYSVDGLTTVKSVQRQTWKHINLGGTYYGAMDVLSSSTCSGAGTATFNTTHAITATFSGATGSLTMTITDPGGSSTFSGSFVQYGAIYQSAGTLVANGVQYNATIDDFTADDDGIRGNLIAQAGSGCFVNFRFAAVRPG